MSESADALLSNPALMVQELSRARFETLLKLGCRAGPPGGLDRRLGLLINFSTFNLGK